MEINVQKIPKFTSFKGYIVRKLKELPIIWKIYGTYTEWKLGARYKSQSVPQVFSSIFANNAWNNEESISGQGSETKNTSHLARELRPFLIRNDIKVLLDAPCGDFNWMKSVDLNGIDYSGVDIVSEIILKNKQKFSSVNKSFATLNILTDDLPPADLIMVRDCLVHFSETNIKKFLENLKRSKIKYLLTTNFPLSKRNYDITTGNWRPINLQKSPFNFPDPKDIIFEMSREDYGQFPDKSLFLWEVSKINL